MLTADPEVGGVIAPRRRDERGRRRDKVAGPRAVAALLRPQRVAEERVRQADAHVRLGVGRDARARHVTAAAAQVPLGRHDDADAAKVEPAARRFVQQTRTRTHHRLK